MAALAAALLAAAYPALTAPEVAALPIIGGAAVLVLAAALALRLTVAVPGAIALLGCEVGLSLVARQSEATWIAAAYGAALLAVSELAFSSIHLAMPVRAAPGVFARHALTSGAVVSAALGIGLVAAAVAAAPVTGSLPLLGAGVGAVVVMSAIVVVFVWRAEVVTRKRGLRPTNRHHYS